MKQLCLTQMPANILTSLRVLQHFPASPRTVLFHGCFAWLPVDSNPMHVFQYIHPPSSQHDDPCHFVILICNNIRSPLVASHSSVLLIISDHLTLIILRKDRLTNFCNLLVIWVATSHVSHPYESTDLTLQVLVFISIVLQHSTT